MLALQWARSALGKSPLHELVIDEGIPMAALLTRMLPSKHSNQDRPNNSERSHWMT
jgi:hypothetical protein